MKKQYNATVFGFIIFPKISIVGLSQWLCESCSPSHHWPHFWLLLSKSPKQFKFLNVSLWFPVCSAKFAFCFSSFPKAKTWSSCWGCFWYHKSSIANRRHFSWAALWHRTTLRGIREEELCRRCCWQSTITVFYRLGIQIQDFFSLKKNVWRYWSKEGTFPFSFINVLSAFQNTFQQTPCSSRNILMFSKLW